MFVVTIPKWKLNRTLTQTETKWTYYKDAEAKLFIKMTKTSGDSLYVLTDSNSYPEGTIFYIQPTRVFDQKEIKLPIVEVRTKPRQLKNLPVYRDGASIEKPLLTFNKKELEDDEANTFIITSSAYSGVQSSHLLTNWIIENAFGNVVYKKLNEKIDLLSLNVKRSLLERWNKLVIKCQHVGDTLEASSFGVLTLDVKNGEKFDIQRDFEHVDPELDLFIPITPTTVLTDGTIKSAVFRKLNNMEGNDSKYIDFPVNLTEASTSGGFTLKASDMSYGSSFLLEIQSMDKKEIMMNTIIPIKIRTEETSKDYYLHDRVSLIAIEDKEKINSRICNVNDFFWNEFEYNKFYSATDKSNSIYIGNVTRLTQPKPSPVDPKVLLTHSIQMLVTPKEDLKVFSSTSSDGALIYGNLNYLIVDSPKSRNVPNFKIYKKNNLTGLYALYGNNVDRTDEKAPIGKLGSFAIVKDEEMLYYMPSDVLELRRINLTTQTLEKKELPKELRLNCMIYNPIFKKFIFLDKKDKLYVLENWNSSVEERLQSPYSSDIEHFRFVPMNNDDTLVLGLNRQFKLIKLYRYDAKSSSAIELELGVLEDLKDSKYKGVIKGYKNEIYLCFEIASKLHWFKYE